MNVSEVLMHSQPLQVDGTGVIDGTAPPNVETQLTPRHSPHGLMVLDAILFALGFVAVDIVRCHLWQRTKWPQPELNEVQQDWYWYLWALPVLAVLWPAVLKFLGGYGAEAEPRRTRGIRALCGAVVVLCVFSALALFFSRVAYPRMQIVLTAAMAPCALVARHLLLSFSRRISVWLRDVGLPDYDMYL